jgi:hypothetical protein
MTKVPIAEQPESDSRWELRDFIAAAGLFLATAAFVLWQNSRLTILWDLSYLLDSSFRISLGQLPYRDFPFAHAPMTFLLQAVLIRLTGRVFFHHVLYAALVGGLGTVLAWRITLHTLKEHLASAWETSLLLAAPLIVLGIYSIFPQPIYDCDCCFSILVGIYLLQRPIRQKSSRLCSLATGAVLVLPLFFKQNIGLPFLLITILCILALLLYKRLRPAMAEAPDATTLFCVLAGAACALLVSVLLLYFTVGIGNYIHWTVQFAAERRLPGFKLLLADYMQSSLLWTLPSIALALVLLRLRQNLWARLISLLLFSAPFLWTIFYLFLSPDIEDRAENLLALWPLLLILSVALTLYGLRCGPSLRLLLPVILLTTIQGTMLSQQLWGSTYAIWPLLLLLVAEMVVFLAEIPLPRASALASTLTAVISVALLVAGGLYAASNERLSYAHTSEGELHHSNLPQLAGMALRGPYLPDFDELIHFAAAEIPATDGLILLPGEDPFYYVTGRTPQFPVLLFDPATDPYSPSQLVELVRSRNIHWLIVKDELQIEGDTLPQSVTTRQLLEGEFTLYRKLAGYRVYHRP